MAQRVFSAAWAMEQGRLVAVIIIFICCIGCSRMVVTRHYDGDIYTMGQVTGSKYQGQEGIRKDLFHPFQISIDKNQST